MDLVDRSAHSAAGEIVVSEQALEWAGVDGRALEARLPDPKCLREPIPGRVMRW